MKSETNDGKKAELSFEFLNYFDSSADKMIKMMTDIQEEVKRKFIQRMNEALKKNNRK